MSARRRWTRCAASRSPVRLGSRSPVRSSGSSANSGSSRASRSGTPPPCRECGVAVTRIRWRSGSAASPCTSWWRWCRPPRPSPGVGAGVGLVDDHQLRAGAEEVVAAAVGLDEVGRDDDVRVDARRATGRRGRPRSSRRGGAGQDELGVEVELVAQLAPATARRGAAGRARRAAATSPRSSSSRAISAASTVLPMPTSSAISRRTGSSLQRHQQRHELVGPRLDGDLGERAERPGAGAEPEPQRVAQQPAER